MELTPEQLREYPRRDHWTPAEALATIETVEGTDCIHGIPLPPYVQTEQDNARWANAQRVAVMSMGEAASSATVQQMTRIMYQDRETYPDA